MKTIKRFIRLIQLILENPGLSRKDLYVKCNFKPFLVRRYVREGVEIGFIIFSEDKYFPGEILENWKKK